MQLDFPIPSDSTGLENLVVMLAEERYGEENVQRYGRSGQSQDGVDVVARAYSTARQSHLIGYQSKRVKDFTLAEALAECDKAKNFNPKLDNFVIVASIPRDKALQSEILSIPASTYPFDVDIWFWDDVNEKLNRSAEKARQYYSRIMEEAQPAAAKSHAEALRRALDRPAFRDDVDMDRDLDELIEAIAGTRAFLQTGMRYDNRRNLIESVPPQWNIGETWYVTLADELVVSLDRLYDFAVKNKLALLRPGTNPGRKACNDFMTKRNAVVEKANRAFTKLDIPELTLPVFGTVPQGAPSPRP
ncbi:hypothetical protein ACIQC5_11565 [Paenarthrobacter sp. NPDC092416]|uniref:hypothetical protein n=1 Tax=Paenarthrobacter sp. NPDC092416 TaxID=3364386 RepID=UPI0038161224